MQIVNLHRHKMLTTAKTAQSKGLLKALQVSHLDQLPVNAAHIPPHVRAVLKNLKIDDWLHNQTVYYAPMYTPAFMYTAVVQGNAIIYIFTALSILILPFSLLSWLHKRQDWAHTQVTKLFSKAFIFVDSGRIYANFPELNHLEQQLSELDNMKKTATQTSKNIALLAQRLKEKLILMGQSTNDPTLADLDNQYFLQQRLINEANEAIVTVENKRQQCLRIRQELFDWVELDWIKQEASQISSPGTSEKLWAQAAEMEMIAHDLNIQLSGVHGELGSALAQWQTRHDVGVEDRTL